MIQILLDGSDRKLRTYIQNFIILTMDINFYNLINEKYYRFIGYPIND